MTSTLSSYHKDARTPTSPHCETVRLQEENAQLQEELQHEHEMYIQSLADFARYHQRTERERARAVQAGKRALLLELLDVLDDFERVLAPGATEPTDLPEAVQAIYGRFTSLLAAQGVTAFDSIGQRFNPTRHEIQTVTEQPGLESGIILAEHRRGYSWGHELLRPAQVTVAR